jgi:hypothetical protein
MDLILEGILKAFYLIFTLDREVLGITLLGRPWPFPGFPGGNWS